MNTEKTITVHDGNGNSPTVLNRSQYERLKSTGMLWEFHPDAPLDWPDNQQSAESLDYLQHEENPYHHGNLGKRAGEPVAAEEARLHEICETLVNDTQGVGAVDDARKLYRKFDRILREKLTARLLDGGGVAPVPELAGCSGVVLYFSNYAERAEFVALALAAQPNLKTRNL